MAPFEPCWWPWWPVRATKQMSHSAAMWAPPFFPADPGLYSESLHPIFLYWNFIPVWWYQEEGLTRVSRSQGRTMMKDAPGNLVTPPLCEYTWRQWGQKRDGSLYYIALNLWSSWLWTFQPQWLWEKKNALSNKAPGQKHLVTAISINWDTGSSNWQVTEQSW